MLNAIGIDFGTNYCRSAYLDAKNPELIPNELKKFETPVWVKFSTKEQKPIVGDKSKPDTYSPTEIPLTQIKNTLATGDALWFGQKKHTPAEVASWIVQALLRDAEKVLTVVNGAVVTVPALASNLQRATTQEAVQRAGVATVSLITEPTAAVIAHHRLNRLGNSRTLVYSLGAGYFEVAIIESRAQTFKTLSIEGDKDIGGNAFNRQIRDYILGQLFKKHKVDLRTDAQRLWLLEDRIEQAKRELSTKEETDICIANSGHSDEHSTNHLTLRLTRAELERLLDQSIKQTLVLVQQALNGAKLTINDIDHILLVGGSTQMPLVQKRWHEQFNKKPVPAPLNIIAQGAALQTASLVAPVPDTDEAEEAEPTQSYIFWDIEQIKKIITSFYLISGLKIGHFFLDKFLDLTMEHLNDLLQAKQSEEVVSLLQPLYQKIQEFLAETHFVEGSQLLENKELTRAKQVMEIGLTYNPKHNRMRREVRHFYLRDAKQLFNERNGQALLELIQRSKEYGVDGDWTKHYRMAGYYFYANALTNEGQWQEAIEYFEKVLNLYPEEEGTKQKMVECYMNVGQEFFHKEQWQEAIEYFEKVLKFYPGAKGTRQKVIECYMKVGKKLFHEGKLSRALFYFKMGEIHDPKNKELKDCVNYLYFKLGY